MMIQGLSCAEVDRDEMEIFLTDLTDNCPKLQVSKFILCLM